MRGSELGSSRSPVDPEKPKLPSYGRPDERSTEHLVDAASRGDRVALELLYRRYHQDVYTLAFRISGSKEDAEDVLQDVFVGMPDALRTFRGDGSFESWIRRIAANRTLELLRREKIRRRVTPPATGIHGSSSSPSRTEERLTLEEALDELPDGLRAVLVLREVEGFTHREIAETLGIRPGTSQVRLHRAKKRLRRILS